MLESLFSANKKPSYSQEDLDILRLIRSENVGPRTFLSLIQIFGSASKALDNIQDFAVRGGRSKPIKLYTKDAAEKELELLYQVSAKMLTYKHHSYPRLLLQIPDLPPVISYKGNIDLLEEKLVAIVGARNSSINGKSFTKQIATDLVKNGITVVSGLARGIDTAAHLASLPKTVGVIAGGIDHIYPPENAKLFEQMAEEGLIIAELPVGSVPLAQHFPQRNRIISGISLATLVIEAGLKSGSLITARLALEQNREVFAMPGFPMDPRCHGTNKLIKDGAHVLESVDDVLEHLQVHTTAKLMERENDAFKPLQIDYSSITPSLRNQVTEALSSTSIGLESLIDEVKLPIPIVYTILLELELAGRISRHPGGRISLVY